MVSGVAKFWDQLQGARGAEKKVQIFAHGHTVSAQSK